MVAAETVDAAGFVWAAAATPEASIPIEIVSTRQTFLAIETQDTKNKNGDRKKYSAVPRREVNGATAKLRSQKEKEASAAIPRGVGGKTCCANASTVRQNSLTELRTRS